MFNTLLSRSPRTRSSWRVRLHQSGVVTTALAVMLALTPGALYSSASAAVPAYTPPPSTVQFTLEGCRNNGGIVLPDGNGDYVCANAAYTSGNLGKGWNELDLVPHRLTVVNSGALTTFSAIIAADHKTSGKVGYDVITPGPSTCQVDWGTQSIKTGVTGGADEVMYRELTITAPANSTCVLNWTNRLALGSHLYSGSSLQSYMFEQADFKTGKKTISIPVNEILPQELSKDMTASQGSNHTWNLTKTPSPAVVTVDNTCTATGDTVEVPVEIKVEWTRNPADPTGPVTVTTNIYAKNPAARTITVNVTDEIYAGTTPSGAALDTVNSGDVDVPANTANQLIKTHTFVWNTPGNATSLNDVATATYKDKVTGYPVSGTTEAKATATIQTTGPVTNQTAVISDSESLTGPSGVKFSVAQPASGSFQGGYTAGTKTVGPVDWKSGTEPGTGSVTFKKTLYFPKGSVGSGTLDDTATLLGSNGYTTSATGKISLDVDTRATLTIEKSIPAILQGSETASFTFDVKNSNGDLVADDQAISFTAGQTSKKIEIPNLAPDTYTVSENTVPAMWDPAPSDKTVDLTGSKCAGTASFSNTITEATAQAVKVTSPAGLQAGWEMTLTRTDTDPDQTTKVSTGADGKASFGKLAEGTYTITEESRTGWDAGTPSGDCQFTVDYPASAGQTFTCSFSNTQRGQIIVKKVTDPVSDTTTEFSFDPSWSGTDFTLKNGDSHNSGTLVPGTYSVTEATKAGWDLTSATCSDGSPITAIDLQAGETVTCTFTNTQLAQLVVEKKTAPSGSTTQFTFTPSGWNDDATFTLADGQSKTSELLKPGDYAVAETIPTGWDLTAATCSDDSPINKITLSAGEKVTCTFTNTQRGQMIVRKLTDPASDAAFTFTPTGWNKDETFTLANGQEKASELLVPGQYAVAETVPTGWDLSNISCDSGDPQLDGSKVTVTVPAGATVTCTYSNTERGQIIVKKVTDPVSDTTTEFSYDPSWSGTDFTLKNGDSHNSGTLVPGTYSVTEATKAGWDLTSATCSDGSPITAIDLQAGETITCTFTNTQRAQLVVEKKTAPSGSTTQFTFTPSGWNDNNTFTLADGQSKTSALLVPGDYAVAETIPTGWDLTSATCSDNSTIDKITLSAGEKVTCTFTNTQRGTILVKKVTDPASDTTTDFTFDPSWADDFKLKNGGTHDSGYLVPGTYSVAETVPTGWDLTGATCDDRSPIDAIDLAAGETITCTFTNTQRGQIIVKKLTDPASDTAADFAFNPSWSDTNFTLKNKGSHDSGLLVPGTYGVSEVSTAGWDLTSATCEDGSPVGAIILSPGETVICTFTNTQRGQIIVEKVTDPVSDTTTEFSFNPSWSGTDFTLKNGGSQGSGLLEPGKYSVSEDVPFGWSLESATCSDGSLVSEIELAAGETVTCTFTNAKQTAQLRLQKQVRGGGTATAADWLLSASAGVPFDGKNITDVSGANTDYATVYADVLYGLSESTGPANYTPASGWVCVSDDAGEQPAMTQDGAGVTLEPGGKATCTITNTRDTAELKLVKTVEGGKDLADAWTLTAKAAAPEAPDKNISTAGGSGVFETVYSGVDYTLAETGPGNYTASTWVCTSTPAGTEPGTQVLNTGDTIALAKGDRITCEITNTRDLAELKLVKTVDGDNGANGADAWTLTAGTAAPLDDKDISTAGGSGVFQTVYSGVAYTLAETGPDHYTAGDWVCTSTPDGTEPGTQVLNTGDTISLAKGDRVTCQIVNTRNLAELKLVKQVEGGSSVADDWTLSADAAAPLDDKDFTNLGGSGVFQPVYSATAYSLGETGPGDYTASDWVCTDAEQQPVEVAPGAKVTVADNAQVTCLLTNTRDLAELKLVKKVTGDNDANTADAWTLSAAAAVPLEFYNFDNPGGSGVFQTVYSNTAYTLAETGPGNYTPSDWTCENGQGEPVAVTDNTVKVGKSAQVTCTITNDRDTAELKLVKTVEGGSAVADDWTLTAGTAAPLNNKNISTAGGSGVFETVYSGVDYTLAETGPGNYTASTWVCTSTPAGTEPGTQVLNTGDTIALAKGDRITCEITNTRDLAELKLVKQVEGKGDPNDWTLSATGPAGAPNVENLGGQGDFTQVWSGVEYMLGEQGPEKYTAGEWLCVSEQAPDAQPAMLQEGDSVTLSKNERVTCTIVNTRNTADLKLVKQVQGGNATADDFTLSAGAAAPDTERNFSTAGGSGQFETVYAETEYTLGETGPGGYTASAWQCVSTPADGPAGTAVLNSGASITLAKGDRVTCTIINSRNVGTLTIVKEFNAQTSGFTGAFDIAYSCVDGATPLKSGTVTLANGQSATVDGLPTGTVCTVTEPTLPTPPAGWTFTSPAFVPASGQVTVTTDQTVSVRVINSIAQVSPVVVKRVCPIEPTVVQKIKKVGNRLLVKKIKTNDDRCQLLKPVVLCKPLAASAAGETAFCDTKVTKKGRIVVKARGYKAVRVTAITRSKPKPGWADQWKPSTWRKSWILK